MEKHELQETVCKQPFMLIHSAVAADAKDVREMLWHCVRLHSDNEPAIVAKERPLENVLAEDIGGMKEVILRKNRVILVAKESGGMNVGLFCGYAKMADDDDDTTVLFVEHLYVKPEYRKQGIATAIIESAERTAKYIGCARLELRVWQFNKGARAFYESLGFRPIYTTMVREAE